MPTTLRAGNTVFSVGRVRNYIFTENGLVSWVLPLSDGNSVVIWSTDGILLEARPPSGRAKKRSTR